jgi:hypothetical protein
MDTKYWGPSGWRLLHLISFAEPTPKDKKSMAKFFEALPYVLPCKFCRYSLSEYMQDLPLADALADPAPYALAKWLWKIHNKVNEKLRKQNLNVAPDPTFAAVKALYLERLSLGCTKTKFEGWEFLFSVVENHPFSRHTAASSPMQGAPERMPTDKLERNKWNMMEPEERLEEVVKFWDALPDVLPFPEWRKIWNSSAGTAAWSTRSESLKTLWGIRCRMETELKLLNKTTFSYLCKELRTYRSGCSKSVRAKTCRKKRPGAK